MSGLETKIFSIFTNVFKSVNFHEKNSKRVSHGIAIFNLHDYFMNHIFANSAFCHVLEFPILISLKFHSEKFTKFSIRTEKFIPFKDKF